VRTIEEDLIQAMYKAEAISEDMRDNLGKVSVRACACVRACMHACVCVMRLEVRTLGW